jgi:hypothetical protein
MKKTSFNQWINTKLCAGATPALRELESSWKSRPGRLTRESVEKRAMAEYGAPAGTGYAAWDLFQAETVTK